MPVAAQPFEQDAQFRQRRSRVVDGRRVEHVFDFIPGHHPWPIGHRAWDSRIGHPACLARPRFQFAYERPFWTQVLAVGASDLQPLERLLVVDVEQDRVGLAVVEEVGLAPLP